MSGRESRWELVAYSDIYSPGMSEIASIGEILNGMMEVMIKVFWSVLSVKRMWSCLCFLI